MNYNEVYHRLRDIPMGETRETVYGYVKHHSIRRYEFRPLGRRGGWKGPMVVLEWHSGSWHVTIHEPQLFCPHLDDEDFEGRMKAAQELIIRIANEQHPNYPLLIP